MLHTVEYDTDGKAYFHSAITLPLVPLACLAIGRSPRAWTPPTLDLGIAP